MSATCALGLAALAAFAGAGCGGAAPSAPRPPRPPEAEAALYVETTPQRAYREVGLVQAIGSGITTSETHVLKALRREGKRLGCDAIVNVKVAAGETKAHAIGVCVRWVESPG